MTDNYSLNDCVFHDFFENKKSLKTKLLSNKRNMFSMIVAFYLYSGKSANNPSSDASQTPLSVIIFVTNLAGVTSNP